MANILIVEDNPMNLEMASALLEKAGHNTIKTSNATDSIKQAKLKRPDLILMDLCLPEMDGLTATKILKQDPLTNQIPIIAFTALVMKNDKEKAFGAGCSGFISKPIDVMTFAKTVESFFKKEILHLEKNKTISEKIQHKEIFDSKIFEEYDELNNKNKYKWHKVLIIDDNPMNAELLRELLDQIGQSVAIAYNGMQALELINVEKFDLILLDVMMPEMSGFEVIKHLKSDPKTAGIPVLFISAVNEPFAIIRGLDLDSYGYITKPYNGEELKARILNIFRTMDIQEQLKIEKNKLDLIFKFSADGIVMLNSSFEIVSCNEQFLEWFNLSKEEAIGKNFFTAANDFCECEADLNDLRMDNRPNKKIIIENKQEKRFFEINCSSINPFQSEAEGYILVLRDISGYKEIESQKETFVATLTHDFKTPIRAEIRALELLLKGSFGDLTDEQISIIQDTLYSSKYMYNMVDNLLYTYKYENGNLALQKFYADINSIIKKVCSEMRHLISDKNQTVNLDFEHQELMLFIDEFEIKRVIMNLLSNAIIYTPENGTIIIKTRTYENEAVISIIDNGRGISKEDLSRLFNKYTSYANKFRQVGTGLGLYLSRQIIEAHDGKFSVESEENKGSTFSFSLSVD